MGWKIAIASVCAAVAGAGCVPSRTAAVDDEMLGEISALADRTRELGSQLDRQEKRLDDLERKLRRLSLLHADDPREPGPSAGAAEQAPARAGDSGTRPPPVAGPAAPAPRPEDGPPAAAQADDESFTHKVQRALKNASFDPGPVDGRMGRRTMLAIMEFQKQNNLPVTGKADKATWALLERYLQ